MKTENNSFYYKLVRSLAIQLILRRLKTFLLIVIPVFAVFAFVLWRLYLNMVNTDREVPIGVMSLVWVILLSVSVLTFINLTGECARVIRSARDKEYAALKYIDVWVSIIWPLKIDDFLTPEVYNALLWRNPTDVRVTVCDNKVDISVWFEHSDEPVNVNVSNKSFKRIMPALISGGGYQYSYKLLSMNKEGMSK